MASAQEPITLEAVMRHWANSPGLQARFVERRELPLLEAPIESRGRIAFVPPDRFSRVIESPEPARLVLDGEELRYEGALGDAPVDPAGDPGTRRALEEIVSMLRGDLDALRERYAVVFEPSDGSPQAWTLTLTPRSRGARRFVERLVLSGRGKELRTMALREPGGGGAVTRFSGIVADRPLDGDALEAFFGHPPTP